MLAKATSVGILSKLLNLLATGKTATRSVGECRNQSRHLSRMGTSKAALRWRPKHIGDTGKQCSPGNRSGKRRIRHYYRAVKSTDQFAIWEITRRVQARRPELNRDRRETGSLLSAGESNTGPFASPRRAHGNVSMKETAAPQMLVNTMGPIT